MVSAYATFHDRPETVDPEKAADPLLDEKSQPLNRRLQRYHGEDAGKSSLLAKLKSGFCLVLLETLLLGFGAFAIFRRDGVYDSVQAWLADPVVIPEQPLNAFGYSFQVRRDAKGSPSQYSNTTQRKQFSYALPVNAS